MCPNVYSEVQVRLWVRLCIIPRVVQLFVCVCMCVHVSERKTLAPSRQHGTNKKVTETGHWKDGLKMRKDVRLGYKKKKIDISASLCSKSRTTSSFKLVLELWGFVLRMSSWVVISLIYYRVRTQPWLEFFLSSLPNLQIDAEHASLNERRLMWAEYTSSSDVGVAMAREPSSEGTVSINGRSACWPGPAVMSLGYFWVILTEKQTHKCKRTTWPLKTK